MGKVLSFGEILFRLVPSTGGEWLKKNYMEVYLGGAEANVALALSLWNIPTYYLTLLPKNLVAEQIVAFLKEKGVDTTKVFFTGERVGTYYLPEGSDLKTAGVIYDRNYSSFSTLRTGIIDWDDVFEGVEWFHFSAISPGLSQEIADASEEALVVAKRRGIKVSLDLNYRSKLWQYGKKPLDIMPSLARYCDLIMGNIWAAETMLGIPIDKSLIEKGEKKNFLAHSEDTSREILRQYPSCKGVANTFRFTSENEEISYYASLFTDYTLFCSSEYSSNNIIDKVGSGDCFMAGLIYGFTNHFSHQQIIDFATSAAFQKLFVKGDFTTKSVEEIQKSMSTNER